MNGQAFEKVVGEQLRVMVPWGVLSNVPIFRPDSDPERTKGFEIDHLIHLRGDDEDLIVIIECKVPPIEGNAPGSSPTALGPWRITRPNDRPNVKQSQLNNHAMALRSFLGADCVHRAIRFEAWLANEPFAGAAMEDRRSEWLTFRLLNPAQLRDCFRRCVTSGLQPQRVEQSGLLSRLRLGLRIPELGHPELRNALEYIVRCRRALDFQIFRNFQPTKGRWAVNGTAGSGKSVLLAYSLFVFASDREIVVSDSEGSGRLELKDFSERGEQLAMPQHAERVIQVVARRPKQVEMLERLWEVFLDRYSGLVGGLGLQLCKPRFNVWEGQIDPDCNFLAVDEAHDLGSEDQRHISEWLLDPPEGVRRYLIIACDRHQRLRQAGSRAPIIQGLSFSGCAKRLARNYRNPFPIYASGLGLMFRWFAGSGPKIVPSQEEFETEIGMEVDAFQEGPGGRVVVKCWNDAHPGNNWSHTVSSFPSASAAFDRLGDEPLFRDDVLWVRFGAEEELFNYEKLGRFTYHNCSGVEAPDLIDKYVKGQEFPVVIIEGLPTAFCGTNVPPEADDAAMWQARQMVFLCCSRCTAFLYFITGSDASETAPDAELKELLRQLSAPENPGAMTRVTWKVEFGWPDNHISMPRFQEGDGEVIPATPAVLRKELAGAVTVRELARRLHVQPSELLDLLRSWGCSVQANVQAAVPAEFVGRISAAAGNLASNNQKTERGREPSSAIPTVPFVPAHETAASSAQPVVTSFPGLERLLEESPATAKARFLKLCGALMKGHPEDAEMAMSRFLRGSREYFARDADAIWRTLGENYPRTAVQQIPGTGWYAMVNLARADIEEVANRVMQDVGVPLDLRMRVRAWLSKT